MGPLTAADRSRRGGSPRDALATLPRLFPRLHCRQGSGERGAGRSQGRPRNGGGCTMASVVSGVGVILADNPNPTEDLGYSFVQQVVAKSRAIWRRQSEKDIGVDGLIELARRDGASAYIAVQVKTGKSYFSRIHQGQARIYLRERLRQLNSLTLPAIIVLYNPDEDHSC